MGCRLSSLLEDWDQVMMGPGFRISSIRLACAAVVAYCGFLLIPAGAAACTPVDPQGPGQLDECVQSFTTPYPTASGETVTDYAIEYIPKNAVNVQATVSFSPSPSSATRSDQPFEPNASPTSPNPDGTYPNPGPNEQAARLVWTWAGTGPSSPSSGTVTFTVSFEEVVKDLVVTLEAVDSHGTRLTRVKTGQEVSYLVQVSNPNDDPVLGSPFGGGLVFHPSFIFSGGRLPRFYTESVKTYGPGLAGCMLNDQSQYCTVQLPAEGESSIRVTGYYFALGNGDEGARAFASATQISDGQRATGLAPDIHLPITGPTLPTTGKPQLDKTNGSARLPVNAPGAGTLTLSGGDVRPVKGRDLASEALAVTHARTVYLIVRARGKALETLNRTGSVKVKINVTFTPPRGPMMRRTLKIKLIKKRH
jgi:hypothetical protein